jgi:hypothetical protein
MKFWNPTSIRGNESISLQKKGSVCGERKVLIFGGKILALTFYSQEGTFNFIERGDHREVTRLGCEGIPVVEDYQ